MSDNQVDTIVIGAGVVGLAIARELTQRKRDVIVIEKEGIFDRGTKRSKFERTLLQLLAHWHQCTRNAGSKSEHLDTDRYILMKVE